MSDRLSELAAEMVAEAHRRIDPALGDPPYSPLAQSQAARAAKAHALTALEAEFGRWESARRDRQVEPPATPG